jgi:hypothetical protein
MTHFAEINNKIVIRVIVAEQDFINSGKMGDPNNWIQTSYNTYGGINKRTGIPIRKNYAGIGYTFDKTRNAFYSEKKYNSWILNEDTCIFEAPIKKPDNNNRYEWNEDNLKWELFN